MKVLTMAKSRRHILLKKTGPQFQNFFVAYEISEKYEKRGLCCACINQFFFKFNISRTKR